MRNKLSSSSKVFNSIFIEFLPRRILSQLAKLCGLRRRRPPAIRLYELLMGLVFHFLRGPGTFAEHMRELTGTTISDSALSQRRAALPWQLFELIMEAALHPRAQARLHPNAFYQKLRLCGVDGTLFSAANTPQNKKGMIKARARRMKAAFAKVGCAVLVELALRNPIAAAIGTKGQSEMELARQVLDSLPPMSLFVGDRYYGVPALLVGFKDRFAKGHGVEFLVRVRGNIKRRVLECYADGSALVEIRSGKQKLLVREIIGRVWREGCKPTAVRLWTSLLDWRQCPAAELLALYARRWEQECFYKELKVDMRSQELLQSHTELTAAQEIAALILAHAVLAEHRVQAADSAEVDVLSISFVQTMRVVRGLWQVLELTEGMLDKKQVALVIRRALEKIGQHVVKRRQRSCPRKVRQPVGSWPRLLKNEYLTGAPNYAITTISA